MTLEFSGVYSQVLTRLGLTPEQARLYEILLRKGARRAGSLPRLSGISRTYVYRQLEELMALGLVTKNEVPGKPAEFCAVHPFALQELVRAKKEEASAAETAVEGILSLLVSEYTSSSRIPGIRILRGIEGIAEVQADTRKDKKEVSLLRSTLDSSNPDWLQMNLEHIKKCIELGIHTRLIGPAPDHASGKALAEHDAARLTNRRILPDEKLFLPANILIYGDKVALTTYQEPIITTIIENEAIAMTFRTIFELIWATGKRAEEINGD